MIATKPTVNSSWPQDVADRAGVPTEEVVAQLRGPGRMVRREDYYDVLLDVRAECQRRGWEYVVVMRDVFERWLERPTPPPAPGDDD